MPDTQPALPLADRPDATAPDDYEWRAFTDDGLRHAWPPRTDGFPRPAICGVRWSARAGHHGQGWCQPCLLALREQIVAMGRALAIVDEPLQ